MGMEPVLPTSFPSTRQGRGRQHGEKGCKEGRAPTLCTAQVSGWCPRELRAAPPAGWAQGDAPQRGPFPALMIIPWAIGATMTTLLTALPGCRQIRGQTCPRGSAGTSSSAAD